jgi:hypothetical protein
MAKGKVTHRIQIHRGGKVQEWELRDGPFKEQPNMRRAYERGFLKRTEDFNQGIVAENLRTAMPAKTVGDAYAIGYADALSQEQPA